MTPTRASLALLVLTALAGCRPESSSADKAETGTACAAPTVSAGADLAVSLGSLAALTATGTVCEGDVTYAWAVETVPVDSAVDTADLDLTDPAAPSFAPDVVGTYVLSVTAADSTGAVSPADYVVVTVSSGNTPPVADCGANLTAEVDERVDLDGSASSDAEGTALEYAWAIASVPTCSSLGTTDVFNGATAVASVVPDCAGVFVVGLAVSDGTAWSTTDYCSITVETGDEAPVADAGDSSSLSPCTDESFELDGYGSYDPEGAELTYAWSLLSAPTRSTGYFESTDVPNPVFHWDETGAYTFQLQVYDGTTWSAPDIVTYTFTDESENNAPVANAGEDQTISVTTDCSTASYVFTCDDCPAEDVELDGSASDDAVDGDSLDFLWSDPSGELTMVSAYSPVAEVLTPSFASTYNSAITKTWDVTLTVSDCADSDTDVATITYTCTGEYSP
jgi:hypothetical protein